MVFFNTSVTAFHTYPLQSTYLTQGPGLLEYNQHGTEGGQGWRTSVELYVHWQKWHVWLPLTSVPHSRQVSGYCLKREIKVYYVAKPPLLCLFTFQLPWGKQLRHHTVQPWHTVTPQTQSSKAEWPLMETSKTMSWKKPSLLLNWFTQMFSHSYHKQINTVPHTVLEPRAYFLLLWPIPRDKEAGKLLLWSGWDRGIFLVTCLYTLIALDSHREHQQVTKESSEASVPRWLLDILVAF